MRGKEIVGGYEVRYRVSDELFDVCVRYIERVINRSTTAHALAG